MHATNSSLISLSDALAGAVERASPWIVTVNARSRRPASGILWRSGVVITAEHALRRDEEIVVTFADGRSRGATLAGRDPGSDLAVLRVDSSEAAPAVTADPEQLRVGAFVLALARPGEGGPAASFGLVSALSGPWQTWRGGRIDQLIRLDLDLYPGFSGGALLDAGGSVLGLVTAGLSRHWAVAVPTATIERVAVQLLERGRVSRGFLGAGLQAVQLPTTLVEGLKLPGDGGVLVVSLDPDGPANRAGLLIGDIVVAFDGVPVGSTEAVLALLGGERIGLGVPLVVVRGGTLVQLTVTIGERPRRES